jgi:uncharacterized membrane protein
MADDDDRDEEEYDDDPSDEYDEDGEDEEREAEDEDDAKNGSRDSGIVETLMSQLSDHREVIGPVATSAAAAAAAFAAKKLPQLIDQFEGDGGDKIRDKLGSMQESGGAKGFAAGAASRALSQGGGGGFFSRLGQGAEEEGESAARSAGGVKGAMAKAADKLGNSQEGGSGWGKGRRLPILLSVDVPEGLSTVYNQWTQFEEMGSFMHRVESVDQESDEEVTWNENIWGRRRAWKAQIVEQKPNERIKWELSGGGKGSGVITFHELAPRLTRVELVFDWQPSGMIEKMASGLRFHKRAARSDLYRFKAFLATRGEESGAWRGRIEDGSVKGNPRNRRNEDADPVPEDQRQHSEEEQDETREGEQGGGGDDERRAARERRRSEREARMKQRT